ncbi:MAG: DUF4097 family beta strand repeat protein [Clostridia bacterium]|nr:DUF4097 family beta strand repeat protein [Clostridia bacterium]
MKKGFMIAAAVLMGVGLALVWSVLIFSDADFTKFDWEKYQTNTYTAQGDITKIEINLKESDVELIVSDTDRVQAVCLESEKVKHSLSVENGTLRLSEKDERKWYDHITFFSKPLSVTLYLPSDKYDSLKIDTRTGDITVPKDVSVSSTDIVSDTGDVRLSGSIDGVLKIRTTTGDVRLTGVKAKRIDLKATTGDILIDKLECADTVSVNVTIGELKASDMTCGSFDTTGSTGDVKLMDTVALGSFTIKRSTGDVRFDRSDAAEITVKTSTGDVSGTFRTEKIFITKTSTGSVNVPDTASGGKCRITTSTGDIDIRVG